MEWTKLKAALLQLPIAEQPVEIQQHGVITNEALFLKTHITVVDKYPQISPRTETNNRHRLIIAKPHYDRLLAYYLLKTQL